MSLILSSPAFNEKERIPDRYTCTGEDISPRLEWTGIPAGARSLALVVSDPDAPAGTWYHWGIFDIPLALGGLPEAFPCVELSDGIRQSLNDFERIGYGGPCPPKGHGIHHYRFTLLALEVESLPLGSGIDNRDVEIVAAQHVLERAVLCGTYSRA